MKSPGLLRKGASILVCGLVCGLLIAGCGGGGGGGAGSGSVSATPSSPGTAVATFIADQQGGSFAGSWYTGDYGSTVAASASAYTDTTTATTQPTVFSLSSNYQILANGSWSPLALANGSAYYLTPGGWSLYSDVTGSVTYVDSGDGTHVTYMLPNGAPDYFSVKRTDLSGTTISCTGGCVTPGTYPTGSAKYSLTRTVDYYTLFNLSSGLQETDLSGAPLTYLPVEDTTAFCDPLIDTVYEPTATQWGTHAWLYYVYFTASGSGCTSSSISAALAAGAQQQVVITWTPTGNTAVPTVLVLTNWYPIYPNMSFFGLTNPWFYSLRAGNVWEGIVEQAGTGFGRKSKIAVNAELTANGYAPIP